MGMHRLLKQEVYTTSNDFKSVKIYQLHVVSNFDKQSCKVVCFSYKKELSRSFTAFGFAGRRHHDVF